MKCPTCFGRGEAYHFDPSEMIAGQYFECSRCQGTGDLPVDDPAVLLKRIEVLEQRMARMETMSNGIAAPSDRVQAERDDQYAEAFMAQEAPE